MDYTRKHLLKIISTLVFCSAVCNAKIPAPPWAARGTGPTSTVEITEYVTKVYPKLTDKVRKQIHDARKKNVSDNEILSLIYAARLDPANFMKQSEDRSSVLSELNQHLDTFKSQWDVIASDANRGWDINNTVANPSSTNSPLTLKQTLDCISVLQELKKRLNNPEDQLDDLYKYITLFRMKGAAMTVYWWAEKLFRNKDMKRAENLLSFLISKENANGFTVGNSYYYLGKLYNERYNDKNQAFIYFMKVHKFPACLVYTAFSYYEAGCVLEDLHQYVNALSLLSIDVPNVDFNSLKCGRHIKSANICIRISDYSNFFKHINNALIYNSNCTEIVQSILTNAKRRGGRKIKALGYSHSTNLWGKADILHFIELGLKCEIDTPNNILFTDALLHDWPLIENIPINIATNRMLNNNVFLYKKRDVFN